MPFLFCFSHVSVVSFSFEKLAGLIFTEGFLESCFFPAYCPVCPWCCHLSGLCFLHPCCCLKYQCLFSLKLTFHLASPEGKRETVDHARCVQPLCSSGKNTAVYQDNVPHSLDKLQGARQKVILMMLKQQTSEAVQHVFVENK